MKKKAHLCFSNMLAFLLVLFTLLQVKVVVAQGTTTDVTVMNDLKKGLNLPSQLDWSDPDPCKWPSITCTNQRVSRIQIKVGAAGGGGGVVTGTLPDSLNSLSALEHLELRGTQLSGPLPTLNGLSSLRELLISQNQFTSIPVDFFQGLTTLAVVAMDYIPFQPWQIPASLQTCSSLSNFSANYANVSGNIPGLFNGDSFPNLVELHLAGNQLQGGLPLNFSSLSSLVSLWLNGQNLSGTIDVVGKMTSLKEIWFNKNVFTGPLPDLSGLLALSDFNIRDNQFTGPVPESLTSLKSLTVVNLTNNNLQGPLPVFDKSVQVDMTANTNSFCLDTVGACAPAVNTFLSIAKNLGYPYRFAENWKGNDPCTWPGISCPNGNITVINFQKMGLTGTISPNFSSIVSVQVIDLSDNNLYGTIPIELMTLPALTKLDLSNNKLTGKVPSFRNGIINTDGNPEIGVEKETPPSPGSPPRGPGNTPPSDSPGKKKSSVNVGVVVGAVIGGAFFVLLVVGVGCCLYRKKHKSGRVQSPNTMVVHPHNSGSDPDMVKITIAGSNVNVGTASETHSHASGGPSDVQMVEAGNMVITIQVLRTVTNNFNEDNVLGRGGFGTVYKGQLHDGSTIAVKRMESGVMGEKGLTEFKSEIAILNKVRHRHLVSLSGYCLDGNERILVYEYMPQGTLSDHLFSWKEKFLKPLEWTRRLSIALDVARGVEYLHGLTSQSFIHRDLKPSNILLGDDMRAKVADFGLIRLAPEGKASIETRLAGTFGYLAPEYAATGRVTTKVDVYAFGVILMELITGRKALDESQPEESVHLVSWFRRMNLNKDTFRKAIDPTMDIDEAALTSISTVSELAGYCCSREPYQRPDMGHVVNVLSSFVELWKPSNTDPEDIYSIDMDLSLAQTLKKWQAFDGESSMDRDTNSFLGSVDNTQTSIPLRPSGFADSFTSADGR